MHQFQLGLFQREAPARYTGMSVYRVTLVKEKPFDYAETKLGSSADAAALLRTYLAGVDREHFVVCMVNRKNRLIGLTTVSVGSLTASIVHPREVYKAAILANAAAVLFGHNHPSGVRLEGK